MAETTYNQCELFYKPDLSDTLYIHFIYSLNIYLNNFKIAIIVNPETRIFIKFMLVMNVLLEIKTRKKEILKARVGEGGGGGLGIDHARMYVSEK